MMTESVADFGVGLLDYLNTSPTAFQAVDNATVILDKAGFKELRETESWQLERNGKYYLRRNHSSLIAFEIGRGDLSKYGFRIIGAHTDSPNFKIKPGKCIVTSDGYVKLNTEVYGGVILSTWFDRPLSIAGRVALRNGNKPRPQEALVDLQQPVVIIPNLCIHYNREVNTGYAYNAQVDTLPLLGVEKKDIDPANYVLDLVAKKLDIQREEILDWELFLYEYTPGILTGPNSEFISASRIDNLSMVYNSLMGLTQSQPIKGTKIMVAFDHEEIGSTTSIGANSDFLGCIMERIAVNLNIQGDGYFQAIGNSMAISADTAHAVHPNYADKHDPENRPILGGGPAIKYSAAQKYATNAFTAAMFASMCQQAEVPFQPYVNRSDIAGGSTIGPAMSSRTNIPTVDVGTAILAMHSVRELGCVIDNVYANKAFAMFFGWDK